jgi:hypothetical protein
MRVLQKSVGFKWGRYDAKWSKKSSSPIVLETDLRITSMTILTDSDRTVSDSFSLVVVAGPFRSKRSMNSDQSVIESTLFPLASGRQLVKVFPGVKSGVVTIVPRNFESVIASQLSGFQINPFRNVRDIDHSLVGEFIDTSGTGAAASQIAERNLNRHTILPGDLENPVSTDSAKILRRQSHEESDRKMTAKIVRN